MEHAPPHDYLPMKVIEPANHARISFSDIEGDRYYLTELRQIQRTPAGEIDYVVKVTYLVFTDKLLPNWKTADSLRFRLASGRSYKKIDPVNGEFISMADFEDRYPDEEDHLEVFYRLPDALNEEGELVSTEWSAIRPNHDGYDIYNPIARDVIDAALDADYVWAFYNVVPIPHGGSRRSRRRTRRNRNRKHRKSLRRKH